MRWTLAIALLSVLISCSAEKPAAAPAVDATPPVVDAAPPVVESGPGGNTGGNKKPDQPAIHQVIYYSLEPG